jgi:hypothetical protein
MPYRHRYEARLLTCVVVALSALAFGSGARADAYIHPRAPLSANPTELTKITLGELSIDGPSLWSQTTTPASGAGALGAALAWTGTDAAHHVNIMTSQDGLHFTAKLTLDEESIARPSVIVVNGSTVVVAWAGIDANHSLNVMWDPYGARQKVTLADNSFTGPEIVSFDGQIWLAWSGNDPNHSLNILPMGPHGVNPGAKATLFQYSSLGEVGLAPDPTNHQLLLTWTDTGKSKYLPSDQPFINFLASPDGVKWHTVLPAPAPQTSVAGPDIAALFPQPNNFPNYFWTWTGTDSVHSLNVAWSDTVDAWPAPITTFGEQCDGSPTLGYVPGAAANHFLIAWTGTDAAHHINIGVFGV